MVQEKLDTSSTPAFTASDLIMSNEMMETRRMAESTYYSCMYFGPCQLSWEILHAFDEFYGYWALTILEKCLQFTQYLQYTLMWSIIINIQEKFRFAASVVLMPTDNAIIALRLLPLFLREVNLLWTHDEYFPNTCEISFNYTLNSFGVYVEHSLNTC